MDEEETEFEVTTSPVHGLKPTPSDVARAISRVAKSSGGIVPITISSSSGGSGSAKSVSVGSGHGGAGSISAAMGPGVISVASGNPMQQNSMAYQVTMGDTKLMFVDIPPDVNKRVVMDVLRQTDPAIEPERFGRLTDQQLAMLHGMLDTALRLVMKEQRERYEDEYEAPKVGPVLKKRPQS